MKIDEKGALENVSKIESTEFIPSWYEAAQSDHFWVKKRFDFLKEAFAALHLDSEAPLRILDIGSGNGVVAQQIEKETSWTVDCADIDKNILSHAKIGRGRKLFYSIYDRDPEFLGQFDVILLLDVLEHIENPRDFARAATAHLKPGGALILNVPALPALYSRYDQCAGHFRRYTKPTLTAELEGLNLRQSYLRYWGLTLIPLLFVRKMMVRKMENTDQVIGLGFQPRADWIGKCLSLLLGFEQKFLPFRFLGSSLIYSGRLIKNANTV